MGGLSWWHWLIIIAAFILIFGAKKLPDAARGVGRSLRILKSEVSAMHEDGGKPAQPAETDASAAVATPAYEVTSMLLLAGILVVLYFGAAGVSLLFDRRRSRREARLLPPDPPAEATG